MTYDVLHLCRLNSWTGRQGWAGRRQQEQPQRAIRAYQPSLDTMDMPGMEGDHVHFLVPVAQADTPCDAVLPCPDLMVGPAAPDAVSICCYVAVHRSHAS